jgi:hypothetical protein
MGYFVATLLAFFCWVIAAQSTGTYDPEVARFSIYAFLVLGAIQVIGRRVIASREVPTRISGMRKPELPELVLTDGLFVSEVMGTSSTPLPSEPESEAGKATEAHAKRLSDILND